MQFDVFIDKGQTEAGAFGAATAPGNRATGKSFEYQISFVERNSRTVIFNSDPNLRRWIFIVGNEH